MVPWSHSAKELLLQEIKMQFKHVWASPLGNRFINGGDTVIFAGYIFVCMSVYWYGAEWPT